VIGQNADWRFGSFEFRAPFFETADDCEQLLIVDLVVTLNGGMLLRKEGNRSEDSFVVVLREDTS
jgi:hypothetical protein